MREIETDYEPYGPEWENEVMKMTKRDIITMYREKCIGFQKSQSELDRYMDTVIKIKLAIHEHGKFVT